MAERVVFVGNIPAACTADEIQSILAAVGPVVSVAYKSGRQHAASARCEFTDAATAKKAIRELHGKEVQAMLFSRPNKDPRFRRR
jgi:RNA recognition motif-containing protein